MPKPFHKIALMGRRRTAAIPETLEALQAHLQAQGLEVVLDDETAELLPSCKLPKIPQDQLHKHCELIIVVGGDGSLLQAAQVATEQALPVLGINRGRLGFLTDIHPHALEKIDQVLQGNYQKEERFLLDVKLIHNNKTLLHDHALNDAVLLPGKIAHLIEFDIFVNQQFVCKQRADGLIVATPTGSTAYALSGGGPILHPSLEAMVLVPMFPHRLSSRPLVVDANSEIEIITCADNEIEATISCDGHDRVGVPAGCKLQIKRRSTQLTLIHPNDYNYFETLRVKLGWQM